MNEIIEALKAKGIHPTKSFTEALEKYGKDEREKGALFAFKYLSERYTRTSPEIMLEEMRLTLK